MGENNMTQRLVLYAFALSHYCEKARWGLDFTGIDHEVRFTMPGLHRKIAKKLGTKVGSLPFLATSGGVIEGSSAIIDWAEVHRGPSRESLAGDDPDVVCALEKRLDDVLGVHIRRFYYSDILLTAPASLLPIFSSGLPLGQRLAMRFGWPKIVPVMIKAMDLGTAQGMQSREILVEELDWLDGLLSDGRPYLTGQHFTRADITAASLLAPIVNPAGHPTYSRLAISATFDEAIAPLRERPISQWVNDMYAKHR